MAGLMQAQRVGSSAFQGTAVMMRPVRVAQPFRPAVVPVVAAKTLQGKVLSTDMTKTAVSSEHRRACPQNCLMRCGLLRGAGECWTPGHLSPVATVAAGRRGAAACPPLLAAAQRRLSTWATGAQQGIPFAAGGQRLGAEALRGGAGRCTCGPGSGAAAGGGTGVLPVWQRRAGCSWPGWGGPGQKARGHVCHACARLWSIGAPCRPPPPPPPPIPLPTLQVVAVETYSVHPRYKKRSRQYKKYMCHDEAEQCQVGDLVTIAPSRPVSKSKKFVVESIDRRQQ